MRATRLLGSGLIFLVSAHRAAAQDTEIVSVDSKGVQGDGESGTYELAYMLTANGDAIFFESAATNLVVNDNNGERDLFRRLVKTGVTERIVMGLNGAEPDGECFGVVCTPKDAAVGFSSDATNLVDSDKNGWADAFVLDLATGVVERVSVDSSETESDRRSGVLGISSDGDRVLFRSEATNLAANDLNGVWDIFVRDRAAGTTTCVSVDPSGVPGDGRSFEATMSADGRYVAFQSNASSLIPNDTNSRADVFLRDLSTKTTVRISVNAGGFELDHDNLRPSLAPDAKWVTFTSSASNLLLECDGTRAQIFAKDLTSGEVHLVTRSFLGEPGNDGVYEAAFFYYPGPAGDEPAAVLTSAASDLVRNDVLVGSELEVVAARFLSHANQLMRLRPDGAPSKFDSAIVPIAPSPDGRHVAFSNEASDLIANDTNGEKDVFVRELRWVTFEEFGEGLPGSGGYVPHLSGIGGGCKAQAWSVDLTEGPGAAIGHLWVGAGTTDLPIFGGHFYVDFSQLLLILPVVLDGAAGVGGAGEFHIGGADVSAFVGVTVYLQCTLLDPIAPRNISLSNAVSLTIE